MLDAHSGGMFKLGRETLGRDREAQPVRVAISSTLTQARPHMKHASVRREGLSPGRRVESVSESSDRSLPTLCALTKCWQRGCKNGGMFKLGREGLDRDSRGTAGQGARIFYVYSEACTG